MTMKARFGEQAPDSESRDQKIRDLFVGGRTIAAHTDVCVSAGIWTDGELRAMASRECKAVVRNALNAIDEKTGVPFAGPTPEKTEDGVHIWRQEAFWEKDSYFLNCAKFKRIGLVPQLTIYNKLATRCFERFLEAPPLIELREIPQVTS